MLIIEYICKLVKAMRSTYNPFQEHMKLETIIHTTKIRNFTSIILITFLSTLVITGCFKEEEISNQLPTCLITTPSNGVNIQKGETVIISVEAIDNDGNITEVRFSVDDIGKGSVSSYPYNFNWATSGESVGSHVIRATSIDNNGGSTANEVSVVITDGSGGGAPVAGYTASPTSGTAPLTVNFTDQSTNSPINYQWNFGDGNTSTLQNPSHTYNNNGTYTVTLTATNNYGSDTENKTNYIVVSIGGGTDTFTDPRDGQTYNTIEIGDQTWFAENLNYQTANSWWFENNSSNGNIVGRLYTWDAALTACPNGWHLPDDDEWKVLEIELGMSQSEADDSWFRGTDEGKKMKSISGWPSNGNGTNSSGFSALPGGYRGTNGSWNSFSSDASWWTSTESGSSNYIYFRHLYTTEDKVYRAGKDKDSGVSVRCLKD